MQTHTPRIIELVGVAGTGKTTLTQGLLKASRRVVHMDEPLYRDFREWPFFVFSTLIMLPTLIGMYFRKEGRWLHRREIAWMVILDGWPRRLKRMSFVKGRVQVMDQGPLSLMAELHIFGPDWLHGPVGERWWRKVHDEWAETIDMLVWLDAPDDTLIRRVRSRNHWHLIKEMTDEQALQLNLHFRDEYDRLIADLLQKPNGPRVVCFNTDKHTPNDLLQRTLSILGLSTSTPPA